MNMRFLTSRNKQCNQPITEGYDQQWLYPFLISNDAQKRNEEGLHRSMIYINICMIEIFMHMEVHQCK